MTVSAEQYRLTNVDVEETERIEQWYQKTYGINLDGVDPQVRNILINFQRAGASEALMHVIGEIQANQGEEALQRSARVAMPENHFGSYGLMK